MRLVHEYRAGPLVIVRAVIGLFAALVGLTGCGSAPAPSIDSELCDALASMQLAPDVALGEEAYLCVGFDAAPAAADPRGIGRIEATVAFPGGGVAPALVHQTSLYALAGDFPAGPVRCETMPADAVTLDVWTAGGAPLRLPDGVALSLPAGTKRFVVQSHVLRAAAGPAPVETIRLCAPPSPAAHFAAWMRAPAPVPAIRPHSVETSTARCQIAGSLHLLFAWPHMHRHGLAFYGAIVRQGGSRSPTADVDPWDFDRQPLYPIALDAVAGDAVETTCIWNNDGSDYVLPGPRLDDEMCGHALVAWPAALARCSP